MMHTHTHSLSLSRITGYCLLENPDVNEWQRTGKVIFVRRDKWGEFPYVTTHSIWIDQWEATWLMKEQRWSHSPQQSLPVSPECFMGSSHSVASKIRTVGQIWSHSAEQRHMTTQMRKNESKSPVISNQLLAVADIVLNWVPDVIQHWWFRSFCVSHLSLPCIKIILKQS